MAQTKSQTPKSPVKPQTPTLNHVTLAKMAKAVGLQPWLHQGWETTVPTEVVPAFAAVQDAVAKANQQLRELGVDYRVDARLREVPPSP